MQNEIPAGTKVKVAVTQKGVTTYQDAEVLAHMDGLVHVDLNGQAVSVDPSQIVMGDAPLANSANPPAQVKGIIDAEIYADMDATNARIDALTARVTALEVKISAPALPSGADLDAAAADQTAAEQTKPNDQASTAAAESGERATGS